VTDNEAVNQGSNWQVSVKLELALYYPVYWAMAETGPAPWGVYDGVHGGLSRPVYQTVEDFVKKAPPHLALRLYLRGVA
jgi:hypothetical protein